MVVRNTSSQITQLKRGIDCAKKFGLFKKSSIFTKATILTNLGSITHNMPETPKRIGLIGLSAKGQV
jgi:hypothetical protein